MIELKQDVGISGEFQVLVRRADGSVRLQLDKQSNLLLDNGIKYYMKINPTTNKGVEYSDGSGPLFDGLVVGSGNQPPTVGQTTLQNFIAYSDSTRDTNSGIDNPNTQHPNHVKLWKSTKFVFSDINNQNISELGLVPYFSNPSGDPTYVLATRALIKGSDGNPMTVTVLEGEVLEVIYTINMYVDVRRQRSEFTLSTYTITQDPERDAGTKHTFEYFLQPRNIGSQNHIDHYIEVVPSDISLTTYGVKEVDTELTASYSLEQAGYQFTHDTIDGTAFNALVSGYKESNYHFPIYHDAHDVRTTVSTDFTTGTITRKIKTGMYAHNHANGIRGFAFGIGIPAAELLWGLVIVKNKANGQGIKKTDRLVWELLVSLTISRWGT